MTLDVSVYSSAVFNLLLLLHNVSFITGSLDFLRFVYNFFFISSFIMISLIYKCFPALCFQTCSIFHNNNTNGFVC